MLREIPALRKKKDLFDDIFGRIYRRVDYKYHELGVFALKRAEEVKMKTVLKDILDESDDHAVMFYFQQQDNKQFNFIIFDKFMRSL